MLSQRVFSYVRNLSYGFLSYNSSFLIIYLGNFGSILILTASLFALVVISLRLDLVRLLDNLLTYFKKVQLQVRKDLRTWQNERKTRKKQAFLEKNRFKPEPEIVRDKPVEIKTTVPDISRSVPRPPEFKPVINEVEQTATVPKPMIKTTLDDVLKQAGDESVDTTLIKRADHPSPTPASSPARKQPPRIGR